jgi:hypothetical protein
MWGLTHAFLTASNNNVGIAKLNGLTAKGNRAQARSAKLVNAVSRFFNGNTGIDGGDAGRVLSGTGGKNLPEDNFINISRRNPGTLKGSFDGNFTKIICRNGA